NGRRQAVWLVGGAYGQTQRVRGTLQQGKVNVRVGGWIVWQRAIFHVCHHTDDGKPRIVCALFAQTFAQRVFVRPIPPRQGFADDGDIGRLRVIVGGEIAASAQ